MLYFIIVFIACVGRGGGRSRQNHFQARIIFSCQAAIQSLIRNPDPPPADRISKYLHIYTYLRIYISTYISTYLCQARMCSVRRTRITGTARAGWPGTPPATPSPSTLTTTRPPAGLYISRYLPLYLLLCISTAFTPQDALLAQHSPECRQHRHPELGICLH